MADTVIPMHRSGRRARRVPPALALLAPMLAVAPFAPLAGTAASAQQASDKFHITAQEKAACTSDAIRFCMHTYPDEEQLLACMKQNHDALTATCRVAFDAGVKRRRL